MNTEIILHATEFANERDYIDHEVQKNISGKLDSYLKKYLKPDDKMRVEVTLTRGKQGISGKVHMTMPGHTFFTERQDFEKLDDLLSHLFAHLKDQMAK